MPKIEIDLTIFDKTTGEVIETTLSTIEDGQKICLTKFKKPIVVDENVGCVGFLTVKGAGC